jgi:DNA mismatch endonuclease (patch repair protein)
MDRITPKQRSRLMASVHSYDTGPEVLVRSALHRRGLRFRKHLKAVPGRPDIAFPTERVAVFIDGDFWHGYRFPTWRHKLAPYWQAKIERNRARDRRNFACLRRQGWRVIRVWEHEIKYGLEQVANLIEHAVITRR